MSFSQQSKLLSVFAALLFIPVLITGCGRKEKGGAAKMSADAAIIPGANLIVACNIASTRDAAIYQQLKDLQEKEQDALVPDQMAELDELMTMAQTELGLQEEDLLRITFSAKFTGTELDDLQEDVDENLEAAFGIELGKAVAVDQLESFIRKAMEKEGKEPTITRESLGGRDALVVDEGDGDDPMYLVSMGKIILGGTKQGLESALGRADKPVALATAIQGSGLPDGKNPQWLLALTLSDSMKAEINEKLAEAAQQPGPNGSFAKCLQGMGGASLACDMSDSLDVAMYVQLASNENATMLKNLFENVALSGIKMMATMATGGQPVPMVDSMTSAVDGATATMTMKITTADIDVFKKLAEKQAQGMGGMAPPPPPMP